MPYVPGNRGITDVYRANNVYANNVLVATWLPPGGQGPFLLQLGLTAEGTSADTPENQYLYDKVDGDNIDVEDASTSSQVARVTDNISAGLSSGVLTTNTIPATTASTVILQSDNAPPNTSQGQVTAGAFNNFTENEYPKSHPIYDTVQLTPNTPLSVFTKKAALWNGGDPKWLKAQKGLTVPQILNNLANLATNCYEPIKAKYPGIVITNTFRQGADQAQHGTGQAMDFQIKNISNSEYFEIAKWIRDNISFDQLLLEKDAKSVWIHLSFWSGTGIRVSAKPINRVLTIILSGAGAGFSVGLKQVA